MGSACTKTQLDMHVSTRSDLKARAMQKSKTSQLHYTDPDQEPYQEEDTFTTSSFSSYVTDQTFSHQTTDY